MMMEVVFLTGVCHPISFNRAQGAYRLAHVVREHGYTARVIDGVGTLTADQIFTMVKQVVTTSTKLFCISSTFFSDFAASVHSDSLVTTQYLPYPYHQWLEIMMYVKSQGARIAVGGHKTHEFERDQNIHQYIDHYVYGYADDSILTLLAGVKESKIVDLTSTVDMHSLTTRYDYGDSFLPGECFTIEMHRGCMFKCAFCAYPLNGKQKGSYARCPRHIVDELMHCYENFGSTNFILNCDTFNESEEYIREFATELSRTGVTFNFGINARIDLFYNKPSFVKLCLDIGVRSVLFGLESSNIFSLKEVGKGLPFEKVVDTLQMCREIWGNQVRMTGSYIIGLPYDTDKNVQQVYEFFTSPDCPLHGIEFDPLYVFNPALDLNPWKSEYSINSSKYGFMFSQNSLMEWKNLNTPYKTFSNSVKKANELVLSFPEQYRSTIKSAAYMHLPNNIHQPINAADKFELVFECRTYSEYRALLKTTGHTTESAKQEAANKYYQLFLQNNRTV